MVSFHFIPTFYSVFIGRTVDISYRRIGQVNHLSPKYFLNILFPSVNGWDVSPEARPYVSAVVILFFIIGVFFILFRLAVGQFGLKDREKYFVSFSLILIPFTMAMFGLAPFYQISGKLPVLNSSPLTRLQSLTSFLLVVLGVLGLDLFIQSNRKIREFYKRRRAIFLVVVEILFLAALSVAMTSLFSDKSEQYYAVFPVFILFALVILTFQLSVFLKWNPVLFLVVLVILVSVESTLLNRRYVPVNKSLHFITEVNMPLVDYLKDNMRKHEGVLVFDSNYNVNGSMGNYGIREKIVHQFYDYEHKALILDTFSERSFATATAPDLASRFTDFSSSLIQLMGVKYLVFPFEFDGDNLPPFYRLVYQNRDGQVYRNNLYMKHRGIFFCRPKYYRAENRDEVLANVKRMDYSSYVFLEEGQALELDYKDNMTCDVYAIHYTPNKVIYRFSSNSDGILTFPEAYHEGWSVTVNGKKADVLRTNLLFRGVAIKEGKGEIVFTYRVPRLFLILIFVSALALACLYSQYAFSQKIRKNRRKPRPA